jgi:tRNA1(Val) A37 N6-methylase TrmN6
MNSLKNASRKSTRQAPAPDYPLQGNNLDISMDEVLALSPAQRTRYIDKFLDALRREIKKDTMALKRRVPFKREMADLRNLLYAPVDRYLYTDDKTRKRNVLGRGSPGNTHTYWSRSQMWKMATKGGNIQQMILKKTKNLVRPLDQLFDPLEEGKAVFRNHNDSAIRNALRYMEFDKGSGTAFPPFHAKFFADKYLPKTGDGLVFDPCAGWGGRMLGSLLVNRSGRVSYYGTDPEKRNKPAYDGLLRRVKIWLKKEISGERDAKIFYRPFEDWIRSSAAKKLRGKVDIAITSPPYFTAEQYNTENRNQSASRYAKYEIWREKFYRPLVKGVYDLLKPGGAFVLNIADVAEARRLEKDARLLASDVGFESGGFYKMAMSINPKLRKHKRLKHSVSVSGALFKYEPVFVFIKPAKVR